MTVFEIISIILNFLLGGTCVVTLATLKAVRTKAGAEAKSAEQEAKGKEIENDEKASKLLMDYIIEPLKKEINALRKDIKKLQKSIERISDCPHADNCPVRDELQKYNDSNGNQ